MTKGGKYVKIVQIKPVNLQCQMVTFWKLGEKLTALKMLYIIWNVKCLMKKETYIWKTIRGNTMEFKVRINQYISDCKTGVSTCKFPRHVCYFGIKNSCLWDPFFSVNFMLQLNKSYRLKAAKKHFHLKGDDTMSNPVEINNQYNESNFNQTF